MDNSRQDIITARNLFSKVERISFSFREEAAGRIPFINLYFRPADEKQAHTVLKFLSENLEKELLKLSIIQNSGDYLTITLLWEARAVLFSSSPDHYDKKECRLFRTSVFYGDQLQVFFLLNADQGETPIRVSKQGLKINHLNAIYYEYLM